ncbi:hypothetical protein MPLB_950035 [Mesorhizobium sp. ORS 3324]|nr:hypothetical protein MPLB_950035 [Mesorhizobium sp. ORS 3324]
MSRCRARSTIWLVSQRSGLSTEGGSDGRSREIAPARRAAILLSDIGPRKLKRSLIRRAPWGTRLEQFQEKCETVFRPELRQNKEIERFGVSVKR